MTNPHSETEAMRELISGYFDNELSPADRARVEAHAAAHPDFRKELEDMRTLMRDAANLTPPPVAEEEWERFLDNVYNRTERRVGWLLTLIGGAGLVALALYFLVVIPWAPMPVRVLTEFALAGLTILFVSVLRQRLAARKTDRYSRDVKR